MELHERRWLFLEGQVLEDVEAQRAIEAAIRVGKREERSCTHPLGRVVLIEALDRQPGCELVAEPALAAAGVEDARAGAQRFEPVAHGFQLRKVRWVVVPGGIRRPGIVAARRLLAAPKRR